jgi:hypothetical protein
MLNEKSSDAKDPLKVNVRMYCHGLGDCFLLTFKRGEKKFNMMIDCGVLQGTEAGKERMNTVVDHIRTETGGRDKNEKEGIDEIFGHLDLVVATHQHWDHISGFHQAQAAFNRIAFDEIWLAWTEDPNNELARSLNKGFKNRLGGLQKALAKLKTFGVSDEDNPQHDQIKDIMEGFFGENFGNLEAGASNNQLAAAGGKAPPDKESDRVKAWDYILTKSEPNKPRYNYCYPGSEPLTLKDFEGVRIYVLGPPHDADKIRSLHPPPTERYRPGFSLNAFSLEDSFFIAVDDADDEDVENSEKDSCSPFERRKGGAIKRKDLEEAAEDPDNKVHEFFRKYYLLVNEDNNWRTIDDDWLSMTSDFALKLDSYTNNTSLVLAIELVESGKVLLFVGDAQSGNWQSWHKYTWEIPDKNGVKQKVNAEDLLGRTVLYKVGHHGSHNATLKKSGLEMMKRQTDLVAMIPVDTDKAHSKDPKWEMPFDALLDDLLVNTNGRVIASDKKLLRKGETTYPDWDGFKADEENLLEYNDKKGQQKTHLFIDYEIEG